MNSRKIFRSYKLNLINFQGLIGILNPKFNRSWEKKKCEAWGMEWYAKVAKASEYKPIIWLINPKTINRVC